MGGGEEKRRGFGPKLSPICTSHRISLLYYCPIPDWLLVDADGDPCNECPIGVQVLREFLVACEFVSEGGGGVKSGPGGFVLIVPNEGHSAANRQEHRKSLSHHSSPNRRSGARTIS